MDNVAMRMELIYNESAPYFNTAIECGYCRLHSEDELHHEGNGKFVLKSIVGTISIDTGNFNDVDEIHTRVLMGKIRRINKGKKHVQR